jgi:hypothetical protein
VPSGISAQRDVETTMQIVMVIRALYIFMIVTDVGWIIDRSHVCENQNSYSLIDRAVTLPFFIS